MVKIIPKQPDVAPIEIGTRPSRGPRLIHKEVEIKPDEPIKEKKTRVSKLDRKKAAADEATARLYEFIETSPDKKAVREYMIRRIEELS